MSCTTGDSSGEGEHYDVSMITASWLSKVLNLPSTEAIKHVHATLLPKQGFLSFVYRLEIEPSDDQDISVPRSLIAKICLPEDHQYMPAIRDEGLYDRELLFYNELAPRLRDLDVVPLVHFSAINPVTREFILLMEDMALRGGHIINQMDGCQVEQLMSVAKKLALFHAQARKDETLTALLKSRLGTIIHHTPTPDELTERFNSNWDKFTTVLQFFRTRFESSKDGFPRQLSSAFGENLSRFLQLTDSSATAVDPLSKSGFSDLRLPYWQSVALAFQRMLDPSIPPYGVAHGDMRLDNLIFTTSNDVVFVDWQSFLVGNFVYDLSWFLAQSPTCTARAASEIEAVRLYHDTLLQHCPCLTYSLEQCLQDYRLGLLISLAHLVNSCASTWFPFVSAGEGEKILSPSKEYDRILYQFVLVALDRSVSSVIDNF